MSAMYTAFNVANASDPSVCEVYFYISNPKVHYIIFFIKQTKKIMLISCFANEMQIKQFDKRCVFKYLEKSQSS